jgi:UrcA family protein
MSLKTKIVLGWVTVVVLSMASSALYAGSAPDEIQHSTAVHYADLNLNETAGVAALYRRIIAAASRVCGQRTLTGSNYPLPEYIRCYNEAIATAIARVDRPQLTAYHQTQAPRSRSQTIASTPSR